MTTPAPETHTYDESTDLGYVRLLTSDIGTNGWVFTDGELSAFLVREGGPFKAAAQALDTIADSEVLTAKVLRTQDLQTDGAKIADALRVRAAQLRKRGDDLGEGASEWGFEVTYPGQIGPELARFNYLHPGWLA